MKKSLVFSLFLMTSLFLQPSDHDFLTNTQSQSPRSISVTTPTNDAYQNFLNGKKAQAVFFAIQSGFDSKIVQPLVDNAYSVCPSSKDFERDVTNFVKSDSRQVKFLEDQINCGGVKAAQRTAYQAKLDAIRNTAYFYRKK